MDSSVCTSWDCWLREDQSYATTIQGDGFVSWCLSSTQNDGPTAIAISSGTNSYRNLVGCEYDDWLEIPHCLPLGLFLIILGWNQWRVKRAQAHAPFPTGVHAGLGLDARSTQIALSPEGKGWTPSPVTIVSALPASQWVDVTQDTPEHPGIRWATLYPLKQGPYV